MSERAHDAAGAPGPKGHETAVATGTIDPGPEPEAEETHEVRSRLRHFVEVGARALVPLLLAIVAGGILLSVIGRDPVAFYIDVIDRGIISPTGRQETIIRMAPFLLIAAGLIIAFRANLWNLGMDGQFLLAAAFTGGLGPAMLQITPRWVMLTTMLLIGGIVGAAWTIVPALLKAYYGINEIITTLMMTFIGINMANLLVKSVFYDDDPVRAFPATQVLAVDDRLPRMFGTRVHIGVMVGLGCVILVHHLMTRTSLGLRLNVLGENPRTAHHAGLGVAKLTLLTFVMSGFFIGIAGAVEIVGVHGFMRADWNPAFGLLVVPLVFLAKMNGWATIAFVFMFAVLSIGGDVATRRAGLPNDFILVIVALVLILMTVTEYLAERSGRRRSAWLKSLAAGAGKGTRDDK